MIEVTAVYHAVFEELAGRPGEQIALEQSSFGALLEQLDRRYGRRFGDTLLDRGTGYFKAGMIALANGRQLEPSTALADGDEVVFLVAMSGGSAPEATNGKIFRANHELCTGCRICELVCSMRQAGVLSPYRASIRVSQSETDGTFALAICRHCRKPLCKEACPVPPAMRFHEALRGVVVLDPRHCIGCLACVDACPFGAIQVGPDQAVQKCDLCDGDPLCVKYCPDRPENFSPRQPYPRAKALEYVPAHQATRLKRMKTEARERT